MRHQDDISVPSAVGPGRRSDVPGPSSSTSYLAGAEACDGTRWAFPSLTHRMRAQKMAQRRAPFPHKPRGEVATSLRQVLGSSWLAIRAGQPADGFQQLERAVIAAIADLEAWDVEGWEQIAAELTAAKPQ